ncbi:hypothetical protein ACWGN5_38525 [Streptomyces sp. NPDC055815]
MSTTSSGPYDWTADGWADEEAYPGDRPPSRLAPPRRPTPRRESRSEAVPGARVSYGEHDGGSSRTTRVASAAGAAVGGFVGGATGGFVPPVNVHINGGGGEGGSGGRSGGGRGTAPASGGSDRHQGDRMIYMVEKIEIRSDRDILALAKAINHLGRELHLILGMRAEEINGVLSTYKGKWYTFGASSRVKARLVSAHLKVSAEAAKALGVGALKMAAAFDRHFVKPEQEAKRARSGKTAPKKTFTIGDS